MLPPCNRPARHRLSHLQRGGGTVDETIMLRHALERLPIYIQDSATTSGEAREYLRDNPDIRLALLDDGLQHLPLVKCVRGARGVFAC
jgi:hypothetical protein